MVKLSEYELEREANIARNKLLLQQLELKAAVDDLGVSKAKAKSTAKPIQPGKREKRKREPEADLPRRQSARLRKAVIDPNESPQKRRKREREEELQRRKEEEERLKREEEARKASRPRHNKLDLIALVENGPEDIESLSKSMKDIPKDIKKRVPDFDDFVYEDNKEEERLVAELRKKMSGLKVHARAKVTRSRVYCAAYHPEVTKDLIFFGDKEGALGIWDARAPPEEDEDAKQNEGEDREGGRYWRIQLHWPANAKSSISSIKVDPIDPHNVYTSSYDTTVRALSFTTGVSREIFHSDNLVNSIDLVPSGHEMWLSDTSGWVTHIDLRESNQKHKSFQLSEQKIGSVSVNPTFPNFLATASNSRTVKVWDVRKLNTALEDFTDSEPQDSTIIDVNLEVITEFAQSDKGKGCLRAEWQHDKSATAAFWDPRGRQLVSTSYDDTLRLWNFNNSKLFKEDAPFPSSRPFSRIKHNCQTGKWVTLLKARWTQNPDVYPYFTIGNMNHSVDIYSGKGDHIASLSDPRRITAVQAVTCSHPSVVERVATANASGRCVLWAPKDL
ncbi:hypothetical protein CC1G_04195 [Coprinopsis cinerea okayama7|uniref:DNA damage-binding protein CMR1 n=1 Tax=Coprinopsis cinerea (strain Okayama-7 / 130 / ATCC MYA-4618 / FGSC 9003) TaxID=240176 RepID=A8NF75_COPC7|nr:hypothetical protein CC1G_04195 [Coprinopsis cinerea okayama7\|eukprot:XP_001833216.1 hypothetical protein CC1G_04195 [Coprinopsis cinerea okayama7\